MRAVWDAQKNLKDARVVINNFDYGALVALLRVRARAWWLLCAARAGLPRAPVSLVCADRRAAR